MSSFVFSGVKQLDANKKQLNLNYEQKSWEFIRKNKQHKSQPVMQMLIDVHIGCLGKP